MGSSNDDSDDAGDSRSRWALLGLGGALSLCCLFAPAAGVAGGAAAGGTVASLGGGVVQIAVTAFTVGALAAAYWVYDARRASDA